MKSQDALKLKPSLEVQGLELSVWYLPDTYQFNQFNHSIFLRTCHYTLKRQIGPFSMVDE